MGGRLYGKVSVITGGASGIGKATFLKFAAQGAIVIIGDVEKAAVKAVVKEITEKGGEAFFMPLDVASSKSVNRFFDQIQTDFEKLDILVNNAGIVRDSTLKKLSEQDFDKVIAVNLKGVYLCAQRASELMKKDGGVILNASSVVAHYGNFGQTNYVAAKSGVIGMTKVWARELGKYNIRVNAVAPGFIQTEMIGSVPEKVLNQMKEKIYLNRIGKPEDVANLYCFLASDEAAYITGAVFNVDGGMTV